MAVELELEVVVRAGEARRDAFFLGDEGGASVRAYCMECAEHMLLAVRLANHEDAGLGEGRAEPGAWGGEVFEAADADPGVVKGRVHGDVSSGRSRQRSVPGVTSR